jgi:hypothetical protein
MTEDEDSLSEDEEGYQTADKDEQNAEAKDTGKPPRTDSTSEHDGIGQDIVRVPTASSSGTSSHSLEHSAAPSRSSSCKKPRRELPKTALCSIQSASLTASVQPSRKRSCRQIRTASSSPLSESDASSSSESEASTQKRLGPLSQPCSGVHSSSSGRTPPRRKRPRKLSSQSAQPSHSAPGTHSLSVRSVSQPQKRPRDNGMEVELDGEEPDKTKRVVSAKINYFPLQHNCLSCLIGYRMT